MLGAVITQNVDTLHHKAGTRELIEVHGSIANCTCPECGGELTPEQVRTRRDSDPNGVPRCDGCGGPLRPQVVLFGEFLPAQEMGRAQQLCESADVILCIGSSLEVQPVASLPLLAHERGGAIAILTEGPTPLDGLATVRLRGDVVQELAALTAELEIDEARPRGRTRRRVRGPRRGRSASARATSRSSSSSAQRSGRDGPSC